MESNLTSVTNVTNVTNYNVCNDTNDALIDRLIYNEASWWLDYVFELIICFLGIMGNTLAIILLQSERLASNFNRLLICLAVFDNLFIISCFLEAIRRFVGNTDVHQLAFIYFFYQLQSIALTCSINITVVLAVERYIAVTRPVEYHIATVTHSPWSRVARYMVPTVLFSVIFNVPKFFELEVYWHSILDENGQNMTIVDFIPSKLRLHPEYSFYYVHLSNLVIKGVLPFGALVYLNWSIYSGIKKRGVAVVGRGSNSATDEGFREERRSSIVLFTIVILFFVCNAPRLLLNFYEFFTIEKLKDQCYTIPLWTMLLTSVSLVLMTINSSVNFFIYCFANTTFRQELYDRLGKFSKILFKNSIGHGSVAEETSTSMPMQERVNLLPQGGSSGGTPATNGAKEARRQLNASSNGKQDPEREEDLELELDPELEETTLNSVG